MKLQCSGISIIACNCHHNSQQCCLSLSFFYLLMIYQTKSISNILGHLWCLKNSIGFLHKYAKDWRFYLQTLNKRAPYCWVFVLSHQNISECCGIGSFRHDNCHLQSNHRAGWGEERFSGWGNIHCVSSGIKLQCIWNLIYEFQNTL